jgi:DNA topoisomerase-1
LEKRGIGRPSTYATILSVIQDRDYVETKERKFYPTELGRLVSILLVEHFPDVMDIEFTRPWRTFSTRSRRARAVGRGTARFL